VLPSIDCLLRDAREGDLIQGECFVVKTDNRRFLHFAALRSE
jgi:hypothetical protein